HLASFHLRKRTSMVSVWISACCYIYMQPTANVVQANLAAGDIIEMVSAVEIIGSSRGILA
ncbi:hypothetical protein ALP85_01493, partial [Pseudomonas syringae pv. syringae]